MQSKRSNYCCEYDLFIVTNLKNIVFNFWSYVLNLKNTTAQGCHVVYLMT